jgi:hypothetical protein
VNARRRERRRLKSELGYAFKNPTAREAAGVIDTWVFHIPGYLDMVRRLTNEK